MTTLPTPEQQAKIEELFAAAIEAEVTSHDPVARDGWIAEAAGGDAVVVREVRSLLAQHERAGRFLAEPLNAVAADLLGAAEQGDRMGPGDDAAPLSPGDEVGPYRIEREIGRGGTGRVYLARDTRLGRSVALKALAPRLADSPIERGRFRREAAAAAALAHPGICTVFAFEEIDGRAYIASEFVEGRTLRQEIAAAQGPPAAAEVVGVARDLAAALAVAHARGIAHRDLKPENVMRTSDGRVKVLDFGLAKLDHSLDLPGEARDTVPGALLGTPAYMAPEQLRGHRADLASDVFAFGVVVSEYATGRHPFDAATPIAMMARMLESPAAPLASRRPDLPASFASAIDRCLSKAPSDRFRSALELLTALQPHPSGDRARRSDDLGTRGASDEPGAGPGRAESAGPLTPARADAPMMPATAVVAPAAAVPPAAALPTWWRRHQAAIVGLYGLAVFAAWNVMEWHHGWTTAIFFLAAAAATVGGVYRGHLLFSNRSNHLQFGAELARARPVTAVADAAIAVALTADGFAAADLRPVAAALLVGLGLGLGLARFLIEPSTESGAFGAPR